MPCGLAAGSFIFRDIFMNIAHMVAFVLVVIGAMNWLLVGLLNWDLSSLLGGQEAIAAKVAFVIVGLAAIFEVATHKGNCKTCASMMQAKSAQPTA